MSLDHALYTWAASQVSGLLRESDVLRSRIEPPIKSYLPTDFPEVQYGTASTITTTLTIRCRVNEGAAYDNSGQGDLDDAIDAVRTALEDATPTISGYTCTPLTNTRPGPARDGNGYTYRDITFEFTMHEGFATAPMFGGDGSVSIAGVPGHYLGYYFQSSVEADYEHTDDSQEIEEINTGFKRGRGSIVLAAEDSATPLPVAASRPSTTFGIGSTLTWTENIIVLGVRFRFDEQNPNRIAEQVLDFAVDNATSPFFTGVAP